MINPDPEARITALEKEVSSLRQELSSLRADLRQFVKPRPINKPQPTFERNLAPEREPEALTDVAQQLSEQVSMDEIGAYLKRDRVNASDIQLTEQDIKRNRPRNHMAHEGYPSREARLEFLWNNASIFIALAFLIVMLIVFLVIL